ncbi:dickkopf-related protein 3a [Thalassophryne amazonica]|uniref:dickkopf-related protein 3a n=1 Tax=Thalassophryne amazonica TaxID=390379 RepID=UPI0014723DE6|nr:dickkopf-related protein 3a [Thalassophryne amazonica]
MRMKMRIKVRMMALRVALLLWALSALSNAILPEIVDSGFDPITEDRYSYGELDQDRMLVQVEQLPEDVQHNPEEEADLHQRNGTDIFAPHGLHPTESAPEKANETVHASVMQDENNIKTTSDPSSDVENNIGRACRTDEDCEKEKYCLSEMHNSRCSPCKTTDVPCTKDEECCGDQLCVWGQCDQNATRGEAGSVCQHQADCSPQLCCAFHKTLRFPVCSAKPIEHERCFAAPNHLMELLSWNIQDEGPKKHCPCAGGLICQHLGRGSMCLKGDDSSEEDLADSLYSDIDYII